MTGYKRHYGNQINQSYSINHLLLKTKIRHFKIFEKKMDAILALQNDVQLGAIRCRTVFPSASDASAKAGPKPDQRWAKAGPKPGHKIVTRLGCQTSDSHASIILNCWKTLRFKFQISNLIVKNYFFFIIYFCFVSFRCVLLLFAAEKIHFGERMKSDSFVELTCKNDLF